MTPVAPPQELAMRLHPMHLVLAMSLGLLGCPASAEVAPEATVPPPRGPALARAVEGKWRGVAEDGTTTPEGVEVSLSGDGSFTVSAGLVAESNRWVVKDDLVILLPDPSVEASDGICFRPTSVAADHLEGSWAYTVAGATAENAACRDAWHPVKLDRQR
jgi:hypothetical protein